MDTNRNEQSPQPYETVNGITHCPSWEQIATVVLYLFEVIVHVLFVLPQILMVEYVSMIFLLAALVTVVVLYIYLTLSDPVDEALKQPTAATSMQTSTNDFTRKYCERCRRDVALASKHCSVCDRCCFEFDHHCNFLNNCIGSKNYKPFLALVIVATLYQSLYLYQGIAVVVADARGNQMTAYYQYAIYVAVAISAAILILQLVLLALHGYLRCLLSLSTYDWIKQGRRNKNLTNVELKYVDNKLSAPQQFAQHMAGPLPAETLRTAALSTNN